MPLSFGLSEMGRRALAASAVNNLTVLLLRPAAYLVLLIGAVVSQGYGAPEYWPSDELVWVAELMIERGSADPAFFNYPAGVLIYGTVFIYHVAKAILGDIATEPTILIHIARSISAIFFILTVYFLEKIINLTYGRRASIFAILLGGTSAALIHHAHIATANSGMFFAIVLAYYWFVRTLHEKTEKNFVISVLCCGFAVGFKYNNVFLYAALPVLWLLTFGPNLNRRKFLILLVALAVSPLPFFFTNPFVAINFSKFYEDMIAIAAFEAPHFQNSVQGVRLTLTQFLGYTNAFFTVIGMALIGLSTPLAVLFPNLVCFVVLRRRADHRKETVMAIRDRLTVANQAMLVLSTAGVAYIAMQTVVNIGQSRYYIPLAITVEAIFLLSMYGIHVLGDAMKWKGAAFMFRSSAFVVLGLVAVSNIPNGFVHAMAFERSSKNVATGFVRDELSRDNQSRIGVISVGTRSPFIVRNPILSQRIDRFVAGIPPSRGDITDWDGYLEQIKQFFLSRNPKYILFEDIVYNWPIFIPRSEWDNYANRFNYPNPGVEAWNKMLADAGYRPFARFEKVSGFQRLEPYIGRHFYATIEGVGGAVIVYAANDQVGWRNLLH